MHIMKDNRGLRFIYGYPQITGNSQDCIRIFLAVIVIVNDSVLLSLALHGALPAMCADIIPQAE